MVRSTVLGTAGAVALIVSAHAGDIGGYKDYSPAAAWAGFYAGAEIGGGIGTSRKDWSDPSATTGNFTVDGVIGGGTAGYNMQWGHLVAGLEADFSGSAVSGSANCGNPAFTCATNTDWLATVRPRVGYAFGQFMPYVTGGLAVGDVHVHSFLKAPPGGKGDDYTDVETGWTAGAGVETLISPNWSLKAEYLYVQLADANGLSNVNTPTNTKFDENVIRIGVNYTLK